MGNQNPQGYAVEDITDTRQSDTSGLSSSMSGIWVTGGKMKVGWGESSGTTMVKAQLSMKGED